MRKSKTQRESVRQYRKAKIGVFCTARPMSFWTLFHFAADCALYMIDRALNEHDLLRKAGFSGGNPADCGSGLHRPSGTRPLRVPAGKNPAKPLTHARFPLIRPPLPQDA